MDNFREEVEKGLGAVVILAGSGSDGDHVRKLTEAIKKYGLPVEARVASAHKQSSRILQLLKEYDEYDGPLLYMAIAGDVDALSGTVSWGTNRPVLTCPPDHPNSSGIGNPPGSSNAYIGRADNAARFAAQMFSYVNPNCKIALEKGRERKIIQQEEYDSRFIVENFEKIGGK